MLQVKYCCSMRLWQLSPGFMLIAPASSDPSFASPAPQLYSTSLTRLSCSYWCLVVRAPTLYTQRDLLQW